jgi:hypothetical protein
LLMPAFALICLAAPLRLRAATGDSLPPLVSAPIANPPSLSFIDSLRVALASETEGAAIRYTLDGSDPTEQHGILYTEPILILETTVLKAVATKAEMRTSAILINYYLDSQKPLAAKPTCIPASGYYAGDSLVVTLASSMPGAKIYYTLDGSLPSPTTSLVYSGPILITSSATLRAVAVAPGFVISDVTTSQYTLVRSIAVRERVEARGSLEHGARVDAMGRLRDGRMIPVADYFRLPR